MNMMLFIRLIIRSYLQDKPDFYKCHPQSFTQRQQWVQ